jgi:iron complex outermembrane receptor protein
VVKGRGAAFAFAAICVPAGLHAADPTPPSPLTADIIVTAQHRAENIKDVPISLSRFGADEIAARHALRLLDLQQAVPNLLVDPGPFGNGAPIFSIRGISSVIRNVGFESGVGVYVDGVYQGRPNTANAELLDVARVEVLRGPQGTLYGKNTTAGAINIVTEPPSDKPTARVVLDYGNYDLKRLGAVVSGPLIAGKLDASLAAYGVDRRGYVRNLYDGSRADGDRYTGGRAKLRATPSEPLTIDLAVDWLIEDHAHMFGESRPGGTPPIGGDLEHGPYTIDQDKKPREKRTNLGASATVSYALPSGITLSSITAWRYACATNFQDNDLGPRDYYWIDWHDRQHQFSQELRIVSPTGPLSWSGGFYYFQSKAVSAHSDLAGAAFAELIGVTSTDEGMVSPNGTVWTRSYAGYGNMTYKLTSKLALSGGVRFTHESKRLDFDQVATGLGLFLGYPNIPKTRLRRSEGAWSPSLSLTWALSHGSSLYATVSRGFKSGGFNADLVASADGIGFGPERVTNYEIGSKNFLLDGRLELNAALFTMDYRGLQVTSFVQSGDIVTTTISNAARARSRGVELDMKARPTSRWLLSGALGYVDARFKRFRNGGGLGIDYDGNRLPLTPKYNLDLSAEYSLPVGRSARLSLRGEFVQLGGFFTDPSEARPTFLVPGHHVFNASIALRPSGDSWQVSIWGKNLAGARYFIDARRDVLFHADTVIYGAPRTVGVTLALHYH